MNLVEMPHEFRKSFKVCRRFKMGSQDKKIWRNPDSEEKQIPQIVSQI